MPMPVRFDDYIKALRATPLDQHTEHTGRTALETLLNTFARDAAAPGLNVQHEPLREAGKGAPDFKVTRQGRILGYVEVKQVGENLDRVLKSDQIKRYRTLSSNIILTDYLEWVWIDATGIRERATLAYQSDLEGRTVRLAPERVAAVTKLISGFFSVAPENLGRAHDLALALASRSRLLRDFLTTELIRQEKEHREGRLHALFDVFRAQVFHELSVREFADAFAQMLAYSLFLARLNAPEKKPTRPGEPDFELVTLGNVDELIPGSFRLIREMAEFLRQLRQPEYQEARWVVDEVLSIVNGLNLPAIREDLSFRQRRAKSRKTRAGSEEEHRLFERDPFIYFYEDYLKAYDPAMRKGRGVYYTPPPIVNFIVRAVDDILKDSFNIRDGLADHGRVTVLDFAAGTGTFLLEVFQRVFDNIGGPESGRAGPIVREHLTKNVFGFEYLLAPYTIAHLKLSQYLRDKGHPLAEGERLQVFLTNTLEPVHDGPPTLSFVPALAEEAKEADRIKSKPVLVITGNPPYSGHSKNKGAWITASIAAYREGFPELSKPAQGKWLQDDYVKFIRFAQMKMEEAEEGVVGIITNHSWLDNPTFKGMRKSLMGTFDQIYLLDLHGNSKKKERAPDGGKDENVFDIEQGVAISLFVKRPGIERGVWHADLWGGRQSKYEFASASTKEGVAWSVLQPAAPDWLFRPEDAELASQYRELWAIPAIFASLGDPAPGMVTTQDEFAISFSAAEALGKVSQLVGTKSEHDARRLFRLCSQDQWNYERAKAALAELDLTTRTVPLTYRPFDSRWTIWDKNVAVHRRERVMKHMLRPNLALLTARSNKSPRADHFFISELPSETKAAESTIQSYSFPLYLYEDRGSPPSESLAPDFRAFLDARLDHHYSPEEILGYMYAVLHAPAYRARYAEFLRGGFPRVPFPETREAFDALSGLGSELIDAHLLRPSPRPTGWSNRAAGFAASKRKLADYHGKGSNEVEAVRYLTADDGGVQINPAQSFGPLPQDIWEFRIGGYQVLDKYLKSRKGRTLTLDEINHIAATADSLAFTIEQMARIDTAYGEAFPNGG